MCESERMGASRCSTFPGKPLERNLHLENLSMHDFYGTFLPLLRQNEHAGFARFLSNFCMFHSLNLFQSFLVDLPDAAIRIRVLALHYIQSPCNAHQFVSQPDLHMHVVPQTVLLITIVVFRGSEFHGIETKEDRCQRRSFDGD